MTIRLLKTINIFAFAVFQGIVISFFGPSLLDLAEIFQSDIEHVSYLSFTCTLAALVGCLSASWIYDHFDREISIVVLILVKGFSNAAIPFASTLLEAHLLSIILGLSIGISEPGIYMWLISLYGNSRTCSSILQMFHLMFAVGSLLGSLIIRPFVNPQSHLTNPATNFVPTSQIYKSYLFGAAIAVVLAISTTIAYLCDSESDSHKRSKHLNNGNTAIQIRVNSKETFPSDGFFLTFQVGFHCLVYVTIFNCFSRYLSIYAVLLGTSKDDGVVLLSQFYLMAIVSRLLSILPASRIRSKVFLLSVDALFLLTTVLFFFFGTRSLQTLNFSITLLGITCGPLYAAGTAFLVNRVPKLSHSHTSILKFMSNSGGIIPPLVIGPIIENTPAIFPEIILLCTVLLFIFALFVVNGGNYFLNDRSPSSDHSKSVVPSNFSDLKPIFTKNI